MIDPLDSKTSSHSPHVSRALFVRLDRIGDLVLTLPTDDSFQTATVNWWIPQGLRFVTEQANPPRKFRELSKTLGLKEIIALAREVRKNRYDFAVIYHAPWWASFVVWLARVPVRIGVKSQWHSFLFLNRGVRQKRSRAETSELEYNFRLLEDGLRLSRGSLERTTLKLSAPTSRPDLVGCYVVHPGMGGSALNWPIKNYAELARRLSQSAVVAITGTASDEAFLTPLKTELAGVSNLVWLDGKLSGTELIGLLENARAVVAPSTGVLHLAASTGVPTLGLFSQVLVQRAVRWGPQGARTAVVEPRLENIKVGFEDVSMELISVDDVEAKLHKLLR